MARSGGVGIAPGGWFLGLDGGEGEGVFSGKALDRGAGDFDALHRGFLGGGAFGHRLLVTVDHHLVVLDQPPEWTER